MTIQNLYAESTNLSVCLTIDTGIIKNLVFEGEQSSAPILKEYVQNCIGYSLREAAEHSAIYVIHKYMENQTDTPNQGINCIQMLDPSLKNAQSLLRQLLRENMNNTSWNFEDRGLSEEWLAKSESEKTMRLSEVTQDYLQKNGFPNTALSLVQIDQYGRLFYEFGPNIPVDVKPSLLLGLEVAFQRTLQERLEVFLTEMKDQNKLRRL